MERMYQDHKDIADFYIVYIREAHASDSTWPVPYAKEKGITQHKDFAERCTVADSLVKDKKLTIPFLIDDMENTAGDAYQAWPDRVYLVRSDGTLGVAGQRGPWGFAPALAEARDWLVEYKKLGREPDLKSAGPRRASSQPDTAVPGQQFEIWWNRVIQSHALMLPSPRSAEHTAVNGEASAAEHRFVQARSGGT